MSRGFPTNTANAIASETVRPVTFAKIEFSAGTIYCHNGLGTYSWDSQDWTGVGTFGSVSSVEEATAVRPYSLPLTLSGLDTTMSSTARALDWYLRPVTLFLGCLSESDVLLDDPTQIWAGHIDGMDMTVGSEESDLISMTCESELANFERASHRKYTNEQLQSDYSGDLFLSAISEVGGAKIRWRGTTANDVAGSESPPNEGNPSAPPGPGI